MEETIFALDVGTRKVAGVILAREKSKLRLRAAVIQEHKERAMVDGQIHNVPLVADVIQQVKEKLERKIRSPLTKVAVAAAGRALITQQAAAEREVDVGEEISGEVVLALEADAVQEAEQLILNRKDAAGDYHCVGYSVINYTLDNSPIGHLVGQRGHRIGVEVIATFLPRVVVDSLVSALLRAGLEMTSLTLEPIAAAALAVPPAMRGLNIALVDVGAGTSDIALAREGSISGYAMVPAAGDEITEYLADKLLLDFNTAEGVKRQLNERERVTFTDIVGNRRELPSHEVVDLLTPAVIELTRQIAEQILLLNGKAPQAVLLIGGGSLTPGLPRALARQLELPEDRVAVRSREVVTDISGSPGFRGPQAITPLGIALTALRREGLTLSQVQVNGRPVQLLGHRRLTVAQALLAAGIPVRRLYGRPGRGIGVEVNGRLHFIRGEPGRPGRIILNGQPVSLDHQVKGGDVLQFIPGENGADARAKVGDLVPETSVKEITFNGRRIILEPVILMNGNAVSRDAEVPDQAKIEYNSLETVADVLRHLGESDDRPVFLNGQRVQREARVKTGDVLETGAKATYRTIKIKLNGKEVELPLGTSQAIFADLFTYLDIGSTPPAGKKTLRMEINNRPAEFTSPLEDGDEIILEWI
ncbi:cell division FtsA domain-containing protein [Thermanaeromonas sp. C210]|uniref:cell division FtsA domain-containing protein n=1 Tax=Thermanaeromonas sp. C210 TaxID=2731925 RepID=UPI00155C7E87|nr:cell division FtsA domain-containing protein [Thermanaeromonas sp. C210]GFN23583.1 cell division protein FtsA [Thermanaeromonas sp. C210]